MARIRLTPRRPPRRPSLTPMIDVVFLLLVFFMLASRFGPDRAVSLAAAAGGGGAWQGAPRLVTVAPGGAVALNGTPVALAALPAALGPLLPGPDAPVVLRGTPGATLADLAPVAEALARAGAGAVVLAE